MIENKCSFTLPSKENFSFTLLVKSVETAYGLLKTFREWENQKKYELFGQCLFKGTQWGCDGCGSETKGRNRNRAHYIELLVTSPGKDISPLYFYAHFFTVITTR